jgi:GDP-L-fucose synthase
MLGKPFDLEKKRIYVAGHQGMVGSAIARRLRASGCQLITAPRSEVDLERQKETELFLAKAAPHAVIVAAAKVGGICANSTYPADFISQNLAIARNVIDASYKAGVEKLLYLGSSCIYPRLAPQPMREEDLLGGPLEPTNQWYAIAKIAGVKLCQAYRRQYGADFISVMPTNLYGPGDNYHPEESHVIAGLIRRFHQSKLEGAPETTVWGTGAALREFLFVDDLADACVFVLERYSDEQQLNIGSGEEVTIGELARLVADVVGYRGRLVFDISRPDGSPRKLLDVSRLAALGWRSRTSLRDGLTRTYAAFLAEQKPVVSAQSVAVSDPGRELERSELEGRNLKAGT